MKKIIGIIFLLYSTLIISQVDPSVTYDPETGNYIIEYEGHEGENEEAVLVHRTFEPSTKIDPLIKATVTKNSDSSYFIYNFELKNSSSSIQRLYNFYLYILSAISEITIPGENWYTGFFSYIPIFHWYNSKGEAGLANPLDGISPDSFETGFSFVSYGLPTITKAYFKGNPTIYLSFPDEPPDEISKLLKPLRKFPNNTVIRETIGPKDPPNPFIPLNFLDTLLNYNQRSFELGWITSQSIADKYNNYFNTAKTQLVQNNISAVQNTLQTVLQEVDQDSSGNLTSEAYALLRYNTEYLLESLPEPISNISTYSLFATHSLWLKQNSDVLSGDIGVNEAGSSPFLDSQVELSIGIGATTPAGYSIKANRIKVKQGSTINGDVYYNELDNNGTITGSQNTPLELPLVTTLPEFKSSTPGTENIVIPQNGEQTLQPGSYGDIQVKKNGRLIFTGGEYNINSFNGGINNQIVFQSPSEVRIADKFDSGQGSYIGPEDTTIVSAKDIIFYVGGINGSNGNLGATPKAAKIGISNTIKANFYVPNGTLWIREHSEAEGVFIGKDVVVGIGVKVQLKSAF